MPEAYRVLVTGGRMFSSIAAIRSAFTRISRENPDVSITLVNGMCDPRLPSGRTIRWAAATRMPRDQQLALLGADWLAHLAAADLGWAEEFHPADWQQHGRSGGFRRNEDMVQRGARVCTAFPDSCDAPRCKGSVAHDSHGTAHCMGLAERAGIETRRLTP